jgi:hypothetical protein
MNDNTTPDSDIDPDYCDTCGHFHNPQNDCPENTPCGDYRCCVNY